jgi:hypothetical protein
LKRLSQSCLDVLKVSPDCDDITLGRGLEGGRQNVLHDLLRCAVLWIAGRSCEDDERDGARRQGWQTRRRLSDGRDCHQCRANGPKLSCRAAFETEPAVPFDRRRPSSDGRADRHAKQVAFSAALSVSSFVLGGLLSRAVRAVDSSDERSAHGAHKDCEGEEKHRCEKRATERVIALQY